MISNGLKPIKKDHRDYSFRRTFGSVPSSQLPDEYDCDAGLGYPNQLLEGMPYGCTSYTSTELCQDEDRVHYQPKYTYDKSLFMQGTAGQQVGVDIRLSLKSLIVYGALAVNETTDAEAATHRRGQYFNAVNPYNDIDAFDDARNSLWLNRAERRSVSVGTPFFTEWITIPESGEVPQPHDFDLKRVSFHCWKVSGWKQINGEPYLIGKVWLGPLYGDRGRCYVSRSLFNQLMAIDGTGAFTVAIAKPGDIQLIQLQIWETILSYVRMLAAKLL